MSDYRLLVSCPLIQPSMEQYATQLSENGIEYNIVNVDQQLDEEELLEIVDDYHAIIAGDDEISRTVLKQAERLQVVVKWGIGTDNIDQAAAEEFGIKVYNTPNAFGAEVADIVFGYAIMLTRHLHHIDAAVRTGDWHCPRGVSLAGKTMGVIGVGDIGSSVARRAHAHGMDVLGNDVHELPADLVKETGISAVEKSELFQKADIVSLNCALTPETAQLVGSEELSMLGADGYLINTSRGELVDQPALVEALQNNNIAGAALDVFADEPLPAEHPLTKLDNVILGTHNAQNTDEAVSRVNDRAVQTVIDSLTEQ